MTVQTCPGRRTRQRQFKRQRGAARRCSSCGIKPRRVAW
jgi:hypothetical protein